MGGVRVPLLVQGRAWGHTWMLERAENNTLDDPNWFVREVVHCLVWTESSQELARIGRPGQGEAFEDDIRFTKGAQWRARMDE